MKQQDYKCSITAATTPEEAFEHIGNVSAWWAKKFEGRAKLLHDIFTVRFGETYVTFEITELVPGKKLVWAVTDCYLPFIEDKTEWTGSHITWEVEPVEEGTRIDMTHHGLNPEAECWDNCRAGWDRHIKNSLFKYVTEHTGMPA